MTEAPFGVALRPATESDCELAFQIVKAALGEYIAQTWGWDEAYQRQRHVAEFEPAGVQIITCGGTDAGRFEVRRAKDIFYITDIYILPEYQGQGIGSYLIGQVLAEAAQVELPVELGVLKVNHRAKMLYERLGFSHESETATHYIMTAQPLVEGGDRSRLQLEYREMSLEEMVRIGEVNREETVTSEFVTRPAGSGFGLEAVLVERSPARKIERWNEADVAGRIEQFGADVKRGGCFYGAFDADRLVGFIVTGPKEWDGSVEVDALFVDKAYRRKKVGAKLMAWAVAMAREMDATALLLYANPTASAISFHLSTGFEIVGLVSKEFVKNIPADIIMARHTL